MVLHILIIKTLLESEFIWHRRQGSWWLWDGSADKVLAAKYDDLSSTPEWLFSRRWGQKLERIPYPTKWVCLWRIWKKYVL